MASHSLPSDQSFDTFLEVGCPEPVEGLSFVYILICCNGSFYIGMADDVEKRLELHKKGFGARHTKQLKEFHLVYFEGPIERERAAKRERQLKNWSRAKKLALILGDYDELKSLSKSRNT